MNQSTEAPSSMKLRVGLFVLFGLLLVGYMTVLVNDRPFWWKPCSPIHRVQVPDATGLKTKAAVRSLGLQVGYLKGIYLSGKKVELQICITAPVEIVPETRAYIRGEGFLGDKFVELKPVRYLGTEEVDKEDDSASPGTVPAAPKSDDSSDEKKDDKKAEKKSTTFLDWLIPSAYAENPPAAKKDSKKIPVGEGGQSMDDVVKQVDKLVTEMTGLTKNLKEALQPDELRDTIRQLNKTLENASKTLAPEGGLNTTAQRTLRKLEDAIEQLRDMMTRINRGEGSIGRFINDPVFAQQVEEALRNVNKLLNRVGSIAFRITVGAESLHAYDGTRGYFQLGIWPQPDRYYLLGVSSDPRGKKTVTKTTTRDGLTNVTSYSEKTEEEPTGLLITAMLGKVIAHRLDLSIGLLHGDGTGSAAVYLGPNEHEKIYEARLDLYSRRNGNGIDPRISATVRPWWTTYVRAGLESNHKVYGKLPYFVGAGVTFDDDDIKLLFALR